MTANGQMIAISPADNLRERLDDPEVAASLNDLLDHADLLAILVGGLDEMIRRGDEIGASLVSAVDELKANPGAIPGIESLRSVDLQGLAKSLAALSGALVDATPALSALLTSRLTDPEAVDVLAQLGQALVDGKAAAMADPGGPKGIFGLWRVSKDKDIVRGLGFMIQVARAFGRRLAQE